jgi:hypothetical protein
MRGLIILMAIVVNTNLLAQQVGTIYKDGEKLEGKIVFNRKEQYLNPIKLIQGFDVSMHRVEDVDSIEIYESTYYRSEFNIGQQSYEALSRRYFKGNFSLFSTRIDQYGDIQLIKNDGLKFTPLFEFNTPQILAELLNREVFIEKVNQTNLLELVVDYHQKNNYSYQIQKLKFRLPAAELKLSLGTFSVLPGLTDDVFDQQASANNSFGWNGGLDLKMSRWHFLLQARSFEVEKEFKEIDFSDRFGLLDLTTNESITQLGLQIRFDIIANSKLTPFIKFGPFIKLNSKSEDSHSANFSDDRYSVQSVELTQEARSLLLTSGLGIEYSLGRHNFSLAMDIFRDKVDRNLIVNYRLISDAQYDASLASNSVENYILLGFNYSFQVSNFK